MRKFSLFFFFILFFVIFLVYLKPVQAQDDCGDPNATGEAHKCCNLSESKLNVGQFMTTDQKVGDRWGCVDILLAKICVSDWIDSGKASVIKVLNTDNAFGELQKLGACKPPGMPSTLNLADPACVCDPILPTGALSARLCNDYILGNAKGGAKSGSEIVKNREYTSCVDCFRFEGFWTGLGCFYMADTKSFIEKNVFGIGIGLAGIIAMFCIIYSAFTLQTSQGNPEKIKKAQERLTSCILGLLLIIFSIFILRLIGVSILGIPGIK